MAGSKRDGEDPSQPGLSRPCHDGHPPSPPRLTSPRCSRRIGIRAALFQSIVDQSNRKKIIMITDLIYSDATELAELIRARKVSSVEVVQAHLDRIQAVNP